MEAESLPQARHSGDGNGDTQPPLLSSLAANAGTPQQHQQQQHHLRHDSGGGDASSEGGGNLSLPWLADRFYLNVLSSLRDGQLSDWWLVRGSGGSDGGSGGGSSSNNNRDNSSSDRGDGGYAAGGYEHEYGPFFSLERLVEVVSGDSGPGIKAALFGTFSLEMGCVSFRGKQLHHAHVVMSPAVRGTNSSRS